MRRAASSITRLSRAIAAPRPARAWGGFLLLALPATAHAAEPAPAATAGDGLVAIDWAILAGYAALTAYLGWRVSRRQETAAEFFTGSGRMNPTLIGVSLFATLLSTITYLALPGETVGRGPLYATNYLAYPLVFVIVAFVLLPHYMRQRVTSAYELLEVRLGLSVRLLGAGMFLALRLIWMSLLLYLTSTALAVIMGVGESWVPLIAFVCGVVALFYTSLGGIRAVVLTDLMQSLLLYGGALLVIGTVTWRMGGFGWFPTEWHPEWDAQPFFSTDLSERVTVVGSILSMFFWNVATAGGDQLSVQRFMSTADIRAARRAYAIQLTLAAVVGLTLACVGFALLGYFTAHPPPFEGGLKAGADKLFPRFIAFELPPVVSGLVLSGIFAAAMSSFDSGVNSISAVVTRDFVERFGRTWTGERARVRFIRQVSVATGAAVIVGSCFMKYVPGNLLEVTGKTANLLTVPIFCLFFFALFVKFASPAGVWIGAVCGIVAATLTAFSGPIFGPDPVTGRDPISFQWVPVFAFIANVTAGLLGSLIFPRRDHRPDSPAIEPRAG